METFYLTRKNYENMHKELKSLKKQKSELSQEIGEAARFGDLRENAEYIMAKQKQEEILIRIDSLEMKLRNCQIVDDLDVDKSEARIGATIVLNNLTDNSSTTYTLVGSMESDPEHGKLSVKSPLASAVLGKKPGEEFSVQLPNGVKKYKLEKLTYK